MARRWADPSAFRADPNAGFDNRPSWRQSIALVAVLVVVAGVIAAVSYAVRPDRARSFQLLHGSLLIGDQFGPVSVDLANGHGTLQIRGADQQAGVKTADNLQLVPFDGGTMLLNRATGEFNMVDTTGFLVKRNGGVSIPGQSGDTTATGIAAGQLAYIERTGSSGTDVLLVGTSTVATAAANPKSVKPRASYVASEQGVTTPGGSASANGDLWALFRKGGKDVVRQLSLPADSSTGVSLTSADHATVDRLSVIESATASADGSGDDVVGVASPGTIRIFGPGQSTRTVGFKAPAGLDSILPTTSARGQLSYLLHGSAGWSLLSVGTDGGGVAGPIALRTIAPDADLATPAGSLGSLYTMLRTGRAGTVYRIEADGKVTVAAEYPQKLGKNGVSLENASFDDAYLIARDSRVIVDSPGHYLALAVFTDGSHDPQTIEKTNLTSVNAANDADALTQGPVDPAKTAAKSDGKAAKAPAPQINNKINCKQVSQKPHVPQIATVDPSARSIGLSWTYPIVDSQDCQPRTYVVSVKLLSNNAPPAPGSVTLDGHLDTIIAGLYPSTQYEFTVTAYINGQSTPSQPVRVTTGKEGPAAPKNIQVSADSAGDWHLSWDGCGSISDKCVATDSWTIKPSICDDHGLGASPATMSAPADSSSIKQPGAVYKGGDSLLGRSLEFRIQGTGVDGTAGDVSATSACVQSWSPPNVSAMTLDASQPSETASTASVNLNLGSNATQNVGGVGATVSFILSGGGKTQTKTVTYSGNSSRLSAAFSGLEPGYQYSATAKVSPPGHSGSSQTTPSKQLTTRADWPTVSVHASCSIGSGFHIDCPLVVTLSGLSSADAHGERFTMTDDSGLYCGSAEDAFDRGKTSNFDPQNLTYNQDISLIGFGGSCTVQMHLVEADGTQDPKYFGGRTSPLYSVPVKIGSASTLNATDGDFNVGWDSQGGGAVLRYAGSYNDSQVDDLTSGWSTQLLAPDGTTCGSTGATPTHEGVTVSLPQSCLDDQGDKTGWRITTSYIERANGQRQSLPTKDGDLTISTTPPGYVPPCTLDQSAFSAAWNADAKAPAVIVSYKSGADIRGCSKLTYELVETQLLGAKDCSTVSPAGSLPDTAPGDVPLTVNDTCIGDVPNQRITWRVQINWNAQRPADRTGATISMSNDPPKP